MKHIATSADAALLGLDAEQVWDTELAYAHLKAHEEADSKRTAERRLNTMGLLPKELMENSLLDERDQTPNRLVLDWAIEQARKRRQRVLFAQLSPLPNGRPCLHANDARGARFWVPLHEAAAEFVLPALVALQKHIGKPIALFAHGALVGLMRGMDGAPGIALCPQAYRCEVAADLKLEWSIPPKLKSPVPASAHLKRLEAESMHIIREAVAEGQNPAMLYAIDKNSSVMLHLARKAFYPAVPPFALLNIETGWKFREMVQFRDLMARESGMNLLVHTNPQAIEKNINPFDHGAAFYNDIAETEGLRQALEHYKFDVIFCSACSNEEKSHATEHIFSLHTAAHNPHPNNQRPELWKLYNTRKGPGESFRVFPLSNWTELDIWQYIYQEKIPIVPLYFAKPRPVVVRPEMIMIVDDERCRLLPGQEIQILKVRLRTLGCYPLTGAVESGAETLEDILLWNRAEHHGA